MTQMYSSNYYQLPTERVSNHTHHLDQGIFFCLFCQFLYIFFNHIFSKCLIDYYILISMKIMLEKAPKTLTRLSDPGPIEKSPLCIGTLCLVQAVQQQYSSIGAACSADMAPHKLRMTISRRVYTP